MSTKNIIIFGEAGAGKSSLVNLIAGQKVAETSSNMARCTLHWEKYSIAFSGCQYKVFDTAGLQHPHIGMEDYLDIIVNAHSLITKLASEGGIDLLLFCVREGRFSPTLQNNYRLFYEWLCGRNVPIVLVLTGLEDEERMEDYWTRNHIEYRKRGIVVVDHACITAKTRRNDREQRLYEESRRLICDLVTNYTQGEHKNAFMGNKMWFGELMQSMQELDMDRVELTRRRKKVEDVLIKRCRMERSAARQLVSRILDGRPQEPSEQRPGGFITRFMKKFFRSI